MKKSNMKKYIPKNTSYCKNCPWHKYIETIKLNKENCEFANNCYVICQSSPHTSCHIDVYKCEYVGYTDYREESLLSEGVKICGVE